MERAQKLVVNGIYFIVDEVRSVTSVKGGTLADSPQIQTLRDLIAIFVKHEVLNIFKELRIMLNKHETVSINVKKPAVKLNCYN